MFSSLRNKCSEFLFREYISDEDLIEKNRTIINIIQQYVADPKMFDEAYMPCIVRMASFAYTLPASEEHHHAEDGGLFEHSLNVSLNAIKSIESTPITVRDSTGFVLKNETRKDASRWKLALFIATLIHDAGKVFTMNVSITQGKARFHWDPFNIDMPLYIFLSKHEIWDYELEWIGGRGHLHEKLSPLIFPHIAGPKATQWLGREKCAMILDAITPMPNTANLLRDFVQNADHESVASDRQAKQHAHKTTKSRGQGRIQEPSAPQPRRPSIHGTLQVKEQFKGKPEEASDFKAELLNEKPSKPQKKLTKTEKPKPKAKPKPQPAQPVESMPQSEPDYDFLPPELDQSGSGEIENNAFVAESHSSGEGEIDINELPSIIGRQLKQMIEAGEILVNNSQQHGDQCILGHTKCVWISRVAMVKALQKVYDSSNIETDKEVMEKLVISGALCRVGDKKSYLKGTVAKSKHILIAMPISVSRKTIGEIPVFKGNLDLPPFELSVDRVAFPEGKSPASATIALSSDDKESAKAFALLLANKLIVAGKGRRLFAIDKSVLEKVAADECVEMHVFNQARMILKTSNVLQKGKAQTSEIKVSVSSAIEYTEMHASSN